MPTDRPACPSCGTAFRPRRVKQVYCRPGCRPGRTPPPPPAPPPTRSARGDGMSSLRTDGAETPDELEFLRAVDRFRRRVPFPAATDYLNILRSLGWRKAAPPRAVTVVTPGPGPGPGPG